MGEVALVDMLGTVDERDARAVDAHAVAEGGEIAGLADALFLGGIRYDGGIAVCHQFVIAGHLCHGGMGKHLATAQQTHLLVEDGTQQDVRTDEPLHQHISLASMGHRHSLGGSLGRVGTVYYYGFYPSLTGGTLQRLGRRVVVGTHCCHTNLTAQ